jgi:hypothetical protein
VAEVPIIARLRPDQAKQIEIIRDFRDRAQALRTGASHGMYSDVEIEHFLRLCDTASISLYVSNHELAERAGLGDAYFSSISRDRRRPKLTNLLKALTVFVEVADERLFDVEQSTAATRIGGTTVPSILARLEQDHAELASLAFSLSKLAASEIEELDHELPNDPEVISRNRKQRELLVILADGFKKIATALDRVGDNSSEPMHLGKAANVVTRVATQVNAWWETNKNDVMDMSVRIPAFAAGVAALGWAGANMTVATSAVAAMVGGRRLIASMAKKRLTLK